jgi:signal transduction histidine kinase
MIPYAWRLSIGIVRAALGISCLVLYVALARQPLTWWVSLFLFFFGYAFFVLWRGVISSGMPHLTVIVDTLAFFVWVILSERSGYDGGLWLGLTAACYIFVLVNAILTEDWPKAASVAGLSFILVLADPHQTAGPLRPIVLWAGVLGLMWIFHKRWYEGRLANASRQIVLHRYEAHRAKDEERQRIAADFHDGPLQSFIGFQMRLEILRKLLARDVSIAAEELRQLQELCRNQVGELRAFVRSMRPAEVNGATLGASISRMVEQFRKDPGITATFLSSESLEPPETEIALELLQIVREALNNVHKHSRASRVAVSLGKGGDYIEISIDDNGGGFPFSGSYTLEELELLGLGPVSIRRRVRAVGGQLFLESRPGQGSGIKVRVLAG